MVEGLAALAGGGDEHREVLAQLVLPDHLVEALRAQALLVAALLGAPLPGHLAALGPRERRAHRESLGSAARTSASMGASAPCSADDLVDDALRLAARHLEVHEGGE